MEPDVAVLEHVGKTADPRYIPAELLQKTGENQLSMKEMAKNNAPKKALEEMAAEELNRRQQAKDAAEEGEEELVLAGLGPGAIFGEMALVSEAPRAAAVEAGEPCTLLVVSREALEKTAAKVPVVGEALSRFCRQRMLSNLVRHSAILGAVDASERLDLVQRFQTAHFEPGDALLVEGEEGVGLFLIASGLVEVVGKDSDGDELRITELGPGDVVGEISLVLRRPANATVRAVHLTVALCLARDEFHKAIKQHPELLGELYETATQRDEETRSVVAQEALDVEDIVLL